MTPEDVRGRYEKLKDSINRYRRAYHVYDREEIPESARDSLMHELAELEARYPELIASDSPTQRVAGTPLPQFRKIRHIVPQWSFNDVFSPDELREFDARVKRFLHESFASAHPSYVCELKIDGLKIVFTDERETGEDGKSRSVTFQYDGGIEDFIRYLNEGHDTIHKKVAGFSNAVMPPFVMSDKKIDALVLYLKTLK